MTGNWPNCRWCGGQQRSVKSPADRPEWVRLRCGSCRSFSFAEVPPASELEQIYKASWHSKSEDGAIGSVSELAARSVVQTILRRQIPGAKVLDFGAGAGVLTRELAVSDALQVVAFEPFGPSQEITGIDWFSGSEESWLNRTFDLIVMSEVVEHLPDPIETLTKLRACLSDEGAIFVTTPNAKGWQANRNLGQWREAQNPAHLWLFSESALDSCARSAGFFGFERINVPVRYKENVASQALLAATQMLEIDGGLRGFLKPTT